MELRHLRYFKAVAELLNFSRAAEQLRVGQPALSRQIQDLEHELDARLLDRTHTRVQLTDAGRTFYGHTCKILAQVDIAAASVQQTLEGRGGELIICNDWRISTRLVLGAIADFRACYPQVEVTLRDLRVHEQLSVLRTRQAHLGFVIARDLAARDELQSLPLLTAQLMVAVGARHRLAEAGSVRIADLAKETWLTPGPKESPGLREFITQICRMSGFTPRFGKPLEAFEAVLGRVATGYGICLVPDFLVTLVQGTQLVRYLPADCPAIELRAVWHRDEHSKLLQQFLGILKQHVSSESPAATVAGDTPEDSLRRARGKTSRMKTGARS